LVAAEQEGGTGGGAEAAVHAGAQDGIGLAALRAFAVLSTEKGLHGSEFSVETPRVENARRVEGLLELVMPGQQGRRQRLEALLTGLVVRGSEQRGRAAQRGHLLEDLARLLAGAQPAQGAVPFDHEIARQFRIGRGPRQGQAPQVALAARQEGHTLLAQVFPKGQQRLFLRREEVELAAQGAVEAGDLALPCGEAHAQLVAVVTARAERKALRRQGIQEGAGAPPFHLEAEAALRGGPRHYAQRGFQDDAQTALRAHHQARDVVARHVLHHLAAEAQNLAAAVEEGTAQHLVGDAAGIGATRSGQAGGNGAAQRGGAEVRRLAGQHLPTRGQRFVDLAQRRAGPRRDDQFAGLITEDAAVRAQRQAFAAQRVPVEGLAAATTDLQHPAVALRLAHLLLEGVSTIPHGGPAGDWAGRGGPARGIPDSA